MPGVRVERPTGRTTWTPGAVSARFCLGRRQTGWELPAPATFGRHPPAEPPPSRSLSAPAGGMSFTAAPIVRYSPLCLVLLPLVGARRRSVRGTGRRQERSATRSRERARRSGAQPGLMK